MTVKSVTFTFQRTCSREEQKRTLEEIRQWAGVQSAAYLKPGAKNAAVARMAYAVLSGDADAGEIASHLQRLDAVESASVPARRSLASDR